jgi:hypothetical protein
MEIIITIIGTIITVLSFGNAIYANGKNKKLINFNREQAWDNYQLSSEVLSVLQKLEKMEISDVDMKCLVSKGEAEARTLAKNSIKMIKRFEKEFNEATIQKWADNNKLHSGTQHVDVFKNYID